MGGSVGQGMRVGSGQCRPLGDGEKGGLWKGTAIFAGIFLISIHILPVDPAHTTADLPTHTAAGLPAHTTADLPTQVAAGLPAHTTAGLPAHTTADLPAHTAAGLPAHTTAGLPANTTANLPAHTRRLPAADPPDHTHFSPHC
eukprot:358949-Chlamydomonas_euryale.AAC.3